MKYYIQSTFERNVSKLWNAHKVINGFEQLNIEEHIELTKEQLEFITREYKWLIEKILLLWEIKK